MCPLCGRFYPLEEGLCFMLPDSLRDDISPDKRREWMDKTNEVKKRIVGFRNQAGNSDLESLTVRVSTNTRIPFDTVYFFLAEERSQRQKGDSVIKDEIAQEDIATIKRAMSKISTGEYAELYDETSLPYGTLPEVIERITAFEELGLPKGEKLLDIGAGTLRCSRYALQKGADYVCGIDINAGMLRHGKEKVAKQGFNNIDTVVADARFIPFRCQVFTRVISLELIEHIPTEADKVFREIFRVLKPGGKAVVNTWSVLCYFRRRHQLNVGEFRDCWFRKHYYPEEFISLFNGADFSQKKIFGHRFMLLHRLLRFMPWGSTYIIG